MPKSGCLTCFIPYLNLDQDEKYKEFLSNFLNAKKDNATTGSEVIAAWGKDYYGEMIKFLNRFNLDLEFKVYIEGKYPPHFSAYNTIKGTKKLTKYSIPKLKQK